MALPHSFSPWDPAWRNRSFLECDKGEVQERNEMAALKTSGSCGNVSLVLTSHWPKSVMGSSVTPGVVFLPQGGMASCTEAFQGGGSEWLGTMIISTL